MATGRLQWLVVVALIGTAARARASQPGPDALPITVLAVKSDDALDQAEALDKALRTSVEQSQGWSLGEGSQPLEFLTLKMKCGEPIDAACEARIADVIKADRFLWTVIKFDPNKQNAVGTVNLFMRAKGTTHAAIRFPAGLTNPNDERLLAVARQAIDEVTGGPPKGGVKVQAGGVAGQVYVDGKPVGALPAEGATFELAPGEHTVAVRAPGYREAQAQVQVRPLATADAIVTMTPGATSGSVDGRMIGGFVTVGIGVALGATGLWAALDVNSIRNNASYQAYRSPVGSNTNACSIAEQGGLSAYLTAHGRVAPPGAASDGDMQTMCSHARRDELVQATVFPLAAVAAGIGGYLIGTSSLGKRTGAKEQSGWQLDPQIGPTLQSLTLRCIF